MEKTKYLNNISKIKKLLSGKSRQLLKQLIREMKNYAKKQEYEEAQKVKEQIEKIQYVTTAFHSPREFLERPTLVDDFTIHRLVDLKKELNLSKIPKRIECYDISNILGKFATGSMVVFTNGKKDGSQYRRFKIRLSAKPNDFEMIRELLSRRFKNDWPKPDLVVIDGGKGQLNVAQDVIVKYNLKINLISLAKRLEEIYVPGQKEPIRLGKESPARQLVASLRDEAHRFAITYHRLLRSKAFK